MFNAIYSVYCYSYSLSFGCVWAIDTKQCNETPYKHNIECARESFEVASVTSTDDCMLAREKQQGKIHIHGKW